ncbi:BTB/POZ and MATH domain-containing protein 2-like [Lolium rigidum]|uniref:BTB/POZ and MATH domain-containing protein 2-like n=1 Tax=Lolium rigidum TaxID=89674 RepID=UPI001F5CA241|nr:BTB/POZ and MATH domain-containing protein 2-like [Lolium rigidum]
MTGCGQTLEKKLNILIHFLHSVIQARPRGSFANFLCRLQPACLPYVQFRLKWTNSHGLTTIWTSLPDLQTSPNNPLGLPRIGLARHYLRPPPPPPPLPPPLPPPAIFSPSSAILPRMVSTLSSCTMEKLTVSRCFIHKEKGTHIFEVAGYSLMKGMGVGKFVCSPTFTIGGYDWYIKCYPEGTTESSKGCVEICLELMSSNAEVRTLFDFGLARHDSGLISTAFTPQTKAFSSKTRETRQFSVLIVRSSIEAEPTKYLQNDVLMIKSVITVIKESQVSVPPPEIEVPPSDILEHLAKLLEAKEKADVTFTVGGETFQAHKTVLAMRSPVFEAELFGLMRETCVTIQDMQPAVFKALLHFVYTDSLPDMEDLEGDDECEMYRHLLVAADRYAMDRLKVLCQNILVKNLDVENVATTLALADQHNCDKLKDVCIEFIASSDKMDDVVATQGYANLKRSCPSVLVDAFEKRSRSCKA